MAFRTIFPFLLCFSCIFGTLLSDPWGKDADLVNKKKTVPSSNSSGPGIRFAEFSVGFFRDYISPADGPRSHYFPSSSKYTLNAIQRYGLWEGFLLGCDRLLRENNAQWVYPYIVKEGYRIKYDPIKKLHSTKTVKPRAGSLVPVDTPVASM